MSVLSGAETGYGHDPVNESEPRCPVDDWVIGDLPAWSRPHFNELIDILLSAEKPFPCTFAVAGARRETLRFAFVEALDDPTAWAPLVDILVSYLKSYRDLGRNTSLIVMFQTDDKEQSLEKYHQRFWSILQYLHEHDPEPWPADLPADPDDPMWEFAFGGTPIFVVCNTPAHQSRVSRNGTNFLITFQPRWVFEHIGPETKQGRAVRKTIRKRLEDFDSMPPSHFLGDYGNTENREYRQYFLPDTNDSDVPRCPFRPRSP
jgi:hypothetical protein